VYSFGIGRNHYEKVFNPANTIVNDPDIPGPGKYTSKMYSMGTGGRNF